MSAVNADPSSSDLYERLGVAEDASSEDIKSAWRAMRKDLHPDSRPESLRQHFDAMMQNVNEAHQTLTDSRARAKYDARRRSSGQSSQGQTQQPPPDPGERERAAQEERRREHEEREAEARRQREEAQRQQREGQARRRRREEQQYHTAAHSGATSDAETDGAEDWEWSEEPARKQSQQAAPRESVSDGATLIDRIPAPVHRVAIYVTGSWLWLAMGALIWRLPITGSHALAALGGILIPLILGIILLKTAAPLATVERLIGYVSPGVTGRYWYARRIAESVALAPVVLFLGVWLAGPLLGWSAIAASAYVGIWVAEYLRRRHRRKSAAG